MRGVVEIRFYGELYEIARTKEYSLKITGSITLLNLIELLDKRLNTSLSRVVLNEEGMIREEYVVLVNGSATRSRDPKSIEIKDEDVIVFLPPAVGGKLYCSTMVC